MTAKCQKKFYALLFEILSPSLVVLIYIFTAMEILKLWRLSSISSVCRKQQFEQKQNNLEGIYFISFSFTPEKFQIAPISAYQLQPRLDEVFRDVPNGK